ncbi:beta-ketoacyl synthase chain length factor [Mucilaginibacter sp.]
MKVYIRSSAAVSPQNTFNGDNFLTEIVESTGTRLKAIDPDYKQFIDPKQIRRMSHVIKMGIAAAKSCLLQANIEQPDAIITGTAFGCMEDTVSFITRIVEGHEEMLPPTSFIQSTHNTVAAQIALILKCHNYNNTFVHKGISFESAMFDAMMMINEREADNILVGGTEEMIDTSFKVLTRLGLYKRQPVSNLSLYEGQSKGTIGGEGAVFFLVSDKASTDNLAELTGLKTLYKPASIAASIEAFLAENGSAIEDIDLIITGRNGDIKNDEIYSALGKAIFKDKPTANYKHLCGEYPTSSSFALWLAGNIVKKKTIPEVVKQGDFRSFSPKKVLIYNHYQAKYHSLMLVSAI